MRALALLLLFACSHGDPAPKPSEPLPTSPTHGFMIGVTDLVTAVADDWPSTNVTLARWHRRDFEREWKRVGEPWPGVVGSAGLAWGDGLHGTGAPQGHDGPVKREGDSRSPAGAFRITHGFGYVKYVTSPSFFPDEGSRTLLDFIQLTDATECVDDPASAAYNTILEHTGSADWSSSEHMRRTDDLYSVGATIDHNPAHTPGHGSCIFLHVWSGPDSTTVGCTAMDKDVLAHLVGTLGDHSVFVLLPRAEYRALRDQWGLPPQ